MIEKILENKPNHKKLIIKLADSFVKAGDYEASEKYIQSLLKLFPKQPYINQLAAIIELNKGNYNKALNYINTAINQGAQSRQTRFIAATVH